MIINSPTHISNINGTIKQVKYIIIHTSGRSKWATDEQELSYLRNVHANKFCYHDYIFTTGEYHNLAPLNALLWHAGGGKINNKVIAMNPISIGIGLSGENLPSSLYPKAQYDALVKGTALRAKELNVPAGNILGHKEVSAYRGKSDPAAFDMNKFRDDVYIELKRNEITPPKLKQAKRSTIVIETLAHADVIYRGNFLVTDFGDKIHAREVKNE